jgi:hypothetical protein
MPPLGVFQLSVILLAVAAQSRVRADSGSFGDSGFYKIVIEKTRVPALEDGIPVGSIYSFFICHLKVVCNFILCSIQTRMKPIKEPT